MKDIPTALSELPEFTALAHGADHVDVESFSSRRCLREFILDFVGYKPGWLKALYALRLVLAKLLGLRHDAEGPIPSGPESVPMEPGQHLDFFTVHAAREDSFWIAMAEDKHLAAYVVVLAEAEAQPRYHVATVVRYRHWTGPLYFTLIRPFHHLVVGCMGRHAAG